MNHCQPHVSTGTGTMNSSLLGATSLLLLIPAIAAAQDAKPRPEDTEQWSPAVPVVLPGKLEATPPPSDAIVLFDGTARSEEHTSELQSLLRISYAVFCLKKKNKTNKTINS